ncbi:hypothetical protein ACG33_02265 [Steroidobacter denitrificans]|uniref:OmpA-like domain-containing protein n=1 Tax=Steroidobacter denitrificans TaxID=465721 RepID=A0A127F690_STEDE|nr:OmpA family protein [Steroidobacter denitrificans]AMN45954.1 hypothetical protein ACG33_02265 [Steroidobacter denitrificans]
MAARPSGRCLFGAVLAIGTAFGLSAPALDAASVLNARSDLGRPISAAAPEQRIPGSVEALGVALEQARADGLEVLAPTAYAQALKAHEDALRNTARGREQRVGERVQSGQAALQRATASATLARQSFGSTLKAREDALLALAPVRAAAVWLRAAERFQQAMKENEAGDIPKAQRRATEAEVLLRDAELTAIKAGVLDEARALIDQADAAKVERLAPRSLAAARRHLADAEQEIQRSRYDLAASRRLAVRASYEARHAMHLAHLIERTLQQQKDGQAGLEALMLSWEEPLQRMAADMELSLRFDEGMQSSLRELTERVQQQVQERRRLNQELLDRDEQLNASNAQLERLEARLGGVAEERIALQRRVDEQERLRANLTRIENSFTPEEARVYRQGEDVILSLLGLRFASGRSAIGRDGVRLMGKAHEALALFPDATISVEGHTDAEGSDSTNLILSQDRADAVKQYLVSTFALDPEKISSIGYGEARPVATNETAAGRARNRRIDLVIHLDGVR